MRRVAVDAARGSLIAIHAAAGLSGAQSREATRLLRAAEGLVRAAVAVMAAPVSPVQPPAAAPQPAAPRRRRPRKRRAAAPEAMEVNLDKHSSEDEPAPTWEDKDTELAVEALAAAPAAAARLPHPVFLALLPRHHPPGALRPDVTYSIRGIVISLVLMVSFYSVVCSWEPLAFACLLSISTEGRVFLRVDVRCCCPR